MEEAGKTSRDIEHSDGKLEPSSFLKFLSRWRSSIDRFSFFQKRPSRRSCLFISLSGDGSKDQLGFLITGFHFVLFLKAFPFAYGQLVCFKGSTIAKCLLPLSDFSRDSHSDNGNFTFAHSQVCHPRSFFIRCRPFPQSAC